MSVFVVGKSGKPLMPCSEKRARILLGRGQAVVINMYPFVIRLKFRDDGETQPLEIKIDPGSNVTGVAVVRKADDKSVVISLFEIVHRSKYITKKIAARRAMRRTRRGRNTRYRQARFNNRTRHKGWLAPSLQHRVDTIKSWVNRISRWAPITDIAQELVKFDMQQMQNPEVSGVNYQQGTLFGYEVREYLLEKWNRTCAYCGKQDIPLQIDHIYPKSKGGSNRVSNLTLACQCCNQKKDALPVEVFLKNDPVRLKKIKTQAKAPLRDASAVNATRWALLNSLKETGLPVSTGTGGQTKFNRINLNIPKTHALDAVCVGDVASVENWKVPTLQIKCTGRGSYQRTRLNAQGGIRGYLTRKKSHFGFQTGDMVKADVPKGKKTGKYVGRVAVRSTGFFNIQTLDKIIQGVSYKHCVSIQRNDGYGYQSVQFMGKEI